MFYLHMCLLKFPSWTFSVKVSYFFFPKRVWRELFLIKNNLEACTELKYIRFPLFSVTFAGLAVYCTLSALKQSWCKSECLWFFIVWVLFKWTWLFIIFHEHIKSIAFLLGHQQAHKSHKWDCKLIKPKPCEPHFLSYLLTSLHRQQEEKSRG